MNYEALDFVAVFTWQLMVDRKPDSLLLLMKSQLYSATGSSKGSKT